MGHITEEYALFGVVFMHLFREGLEESHFESGVHTPIDNMRRHTNGGVVEGSLNIVSE